MSNFLSSKSSQSTLNIRWQFGLETDIGGGKENQDDSFVWMQKRSNIGDRVTVLCVLDGHGREVGKVAAVAAKNRLFSYLDENYLELVRADSNGDTSAVARFLVEAHIAAHNEIRNAFRQELESLGFEVRESSSFDEFRVLSSTANSSPVGVDGGSYLLKRRPPSTQWTCIHGGSSCTLVAVVGSRVYVANVGDSSALLCSSHPCMSSHANLTYLLDSA
eukprot:gene42056-56946_t